MIYVFLLYILVLYLLSTEPVSYTHSRIIDVMTAGWGFYEMQWTALVKLHEYTNYDWEKKPKYMVKGQFMVFNEPSPSDEQH